MVLEDLHNEIYNTLTGVTGIYFVDQDRGQYLKPENFQQFNTPALFIKFDVTDVQQLLGTQYFTLDITISSIIKGYTKGSPVFYFYDVMNNVYKALQNQHYDQLTSPIIRTELTFDDNVGDFYLGYSKYVTVIEERSTLDINAGNTEKYVNYEVISKLSPSGETFTDIYYNTSGTTN